MKQRRHTAAAFLLSSVMAISACAMTMTPMSASAGSIAMNSEATGTYTAYQLLTGTIAEDGAFGNPQFGSALPEGVTAELEHELQNDSVFGERFNNLSAGDDRAAALAFVKALDGIANDDDEAQEFAKIIGKYVTADSGTAVTKTAQTVDDGYYMIKQATVADGETGTRNLLLVAGDKTTIATKVEAPTSDKTVDDKNDSNGASELNATGQTSADYDIGDDVPYVLTFTLPADYDAYNKYPVTFIDDMCAGLTYNGDAKIWYGEVSGDGEDITFTQDETATSATAGGKVYKAKINDLKTKTGLAPGSVITIKYTAKLNDQAVVGNPGNPNTYKVQFANNPGFSGTGEPTTSETPEKTNVVFTYKLVVNKTDKDGKPLEGADFSLYKWESTDVNPSPFASDSGWVKIERKEPSATTFTFNGLDDGIYKLVETVTPNGYNTIDPLVFTISATHVENAPDDIVLTKLEATGDLVLNDADANGILEASIENEKGIILPSTGGIGTVIFYVVGSLLIGGAAVLFVTKRKNSVKEK